MPRLCRVCVHPQRDDIDRAILDGLDDKVIAQRFGELSRQSVQRHGARHVPEALRVVFEAERTKKARTLLDRVNRHVDRLERMADEADEKQRPEFLAVSRELTSALNLLGKATGEIQTGAQVQVNVLNAVYQKLGVKDEAELRGLVEGGRKYEQASRDASLEEYRDSGVELLLMVFGEHPEWRDEVVDRLSSHPLRAISSG